MFTDRTPMRWPGAWKDPSLLDLLKGTAINCLIVDRGGDVGRVVERAGQDGLQVFESATSPAGVTLVEGEWPGVKLSESGAVDRIAAGPTGNPWVDSNGWKIRLNAALYPGNSCWVSATPGGRGVKTVAYVLAIADAAAHGGRWMIDLDEGFATALSGQRPEAIESWQQLAGAAGFFARPKAWSSYLPEAVLGVISDFSGPNESLSHEILNLVARTLQQYRILPKSEVANPSFQGLKAVLYPDGQPPAPKLREQILAFVESGGTLITGPAWGALPVSPTTDRSHPRYEWGLLGKGRVAMAQESFEDPYRVANDALILVGHRYDLLRFWNGGSIGAHFALNRERRRGIVHMLFYATFSHQPTVWVAGKFRKAKLWTLDRPASRNVEMQIQKDGVELYLPSVSQYAAVELEA